MQANINTDWYLEQMLLLLQPLAEMKWPYSSVIRPAECASGLIYVEQLRRFTFLYLNLTTKKSTVEYELVNKLYKLTVNLHSQLHRLKPQSLSATTEAENLRLEVKESFDAIKIVAMRLFPNQPELWYGLSLPPS